jgi:hypothetical protein
MTKPKSFLDGSPAGYLGTVIVAIIVILAFEMHKPYVPVDYKDFTRRFVNEICNDPMQNGSAFEQNRSYANSSRSMEEISEMKTAIDGISTIVIDLSHQLSMLNGIVMKCSNNMTFLNYSEVRNNINALIESLSYMPMQCSEQPNETQSCE